MLIELAKLNDYGDITALLSESGVPMSVVPDHIEDCLVLRSGRNVVGIANLRCIDNIAVGLCLVVRPGFRRMGLGKRLGQAMFEHCQFKGISRLFIYSDLAPFYFRALGFAPTDGSRVPGTVYSLLYELRNGAPLVGSHLLEYRVPVAACHSVLG